MGMGGVAFLRASRPGRTVEQGEFGAALLCMIIGEMGMGIALARH
jgi:hypothetical protein